MKFLKLFSLVCLVCANSHALAQEEEQADPVREKERKRLTELYISADPFNHSLLEHSSPVTVLQKDEVLRKAQTTIGETVAQEPGVTSSYFGPGASRPVIRGNAGDRVRVLKNGIGTLDVSNTSEDHVVTTSPLTAETVEILRGPETLMFGSSAIGGVVNVTDNSIPETEVGADLTGALDYRQGTADDELTGAAVLEGQIDLSEDGDSLNWHLDYFHQDTDVIDIPGFSESQAQRALEEAEHAEEEEGEEHDEEEEGHDEEEEANGTLPSSQTRSQGFTAGVSHVFENGFWGVSVNGFDSNYGIPGHAHEDEHGHEEEEGEEHDEEEEEHGEEEEESVAIDLEQIRVDLRGEVNELGGAIETAKFKVGLSNYDHKELEGSEVGSSFENDAIESRVELIHAPIGPVEGVIGVQILASEFSSEGEEAFLPNVDTFSPAIFIFEELELNDYWTLQAGGRFEHVNFDADGLSSDEFNPFGFSLGTVWDPTAEGDYTMGLSFAYTERAPSFTELYADGVHVARSIFERGDKSLDIEQSYGFDLTMKKNSGLVTGVLNLFVQDYDDYINLAGTGEEEDGQNVFQYESVAALFWGFESELTLHLHELLGLMVHDLDLHAQVDLVRAKNSTRSEELPRIPPLRTIVGADYFYNDRYGASVEGVFVEKQDNLAPFEIATESYQLLNADVSFKVPLNKGLKDLTVYVRGTNLTDEEARVHSSFIKDLAPLRGRNFLFGVRGTF